MDSVAAIYLAKIAILPPGFNALLAILGLGLGAFGQRRARDACLLVSAGTLWLFCTMPFAARLERTVEIYPGRTVAELTQQSAQAIVVMGAGGNDNAPEYGGSAISLTGLARVRFAARLAHATGLPLLLTGGIVFGGGPSEAALMDDVLRRDFGLRARWLESASRNTWQNAERSAPLLRQAGLSKVLLVTSAAHMRRSVVAFEAQGLTVIPAPTWFRGHKRAGVPWLLRVAPSADALKLSRDAIHEWVGLTWYRLYHRA